MTSRLLNGLKAYLGSLDWEAERQIYAGECVFEVSMIVYLDHSSKRMSTSQLLM